MKQRTGHHTWVKLTYWSTESFLAIPEPKRYVPHETQSPKRNEPKLDFFLDLILVTSFLVHETWIYLTKIEKGGATLLHLIPSKEPNLCYFFSHLTRWFGLVKDCRSCGGTDGSWRDGGWKSHRVWKILCCNYKGCSSQSASTTSDLKLKFSCVFLKWSRFDIFA